MIRNNNIKKMLDFVKNSNPSIHEYDDFINKNFKPDLFEEIKLVIRNYVEVDDNTKLILSSFGISFLEDYDHVPKILLALYINTSSHSSRTRTRQMLNTLAEKFADSKDIRHYILPTKDQPTKIECIYPNGLLNNEDLKSYREELDRAVKLVETRLIEDDLLFRLYEQVVNAKSHGNKIIDFTDENVKPIIDELELLYKDTKLD